MREELTIEPVSLYKYRDDSARTEEIIRSRKVWLSLPSQLNDPLECKTGNIPEGWKARTIRELETAQIMGMLGLPIPGVPKTLYSLSERKTKLWLKRFRTLTHREKVIAMRKLHSDHHIELSRPEEVFDDMQRRLRAVGVFSLSECNDNELMWAHYASSHGGIALGFERENGSKLANPRHTLAVTYTSEKPHFEAGFKNEVAFYPRLGGGMQSKGRVSFEDQVFRASLSTKTPAWSYEREWRYIEESHGLFDWPGRLTSVCFGMRMSPERRRHYRHLVENSVGKNVEYFEVILSSTLNGLAVRRI